MKRKNVPNYLFTLVYDNTPVLPIYLIFDKRLLCFIDVLGVFRLSFPKGVKKPWFDPSGSVCLSSRSWRSTLSLLAPQAEAWSLRLRLWLGLWLRLWLRLWLGRLLDESMVSDVLCGCGCYNSCYSVAVTVVRLRIGCGCGYGCDSGCGCSLRLPSCVAAAMLGYSPAAPPAQAPTPAKKPVIESSAMPTEPAPATSMPRPGPALSLALRRRCRPRQSDSRQSCARIAQDQRDRPRRTAVR